MSLQRLSVCHFLLTATELQVAYQLDHDSRRWRSTLQYPALRAHELSVPALRVPAPPPSVFSGAQRPQRPRPPCPHHSCPPTLCVPTLHALPNDGTNILVDLIIALHYLWPQQPSSYLQPSLVRDLVSTSSVAGVRGTRRITDPHGVRATAACCIAVLTCCRQDSSRSSLGYQRGGACGLLGVPR